MLILSTKDRGYVGLVDADRALLPFSRILVRSSLWFVLVEGRFMVSTVWWSRGGSELVGLDSFSGLLSVWSLEIEI